MTKTVLFSASDGVSGTEIYAIDSPGATPRLVKDLNPGSDSS